MWNPFNKLASSKQKFLSAPELQEFERQRNDISVIEKSSKKLQHDMKEYSAALQSFSKAQARLPLNFTQSNIQAPNVISISDVWSKGALEEEKLNQEYVQRFQTVAVEPVKRYNNVFPHWHNGLKKWEHTIQQTAKEQEKIDKYRDKEKTAQNVAKLEQHTKDFEQSKVEFENVHSRVASDMSIFCNSRKDYFDPTVEALIQIQIDHTKKLQKLYTNLCAQIQADSLGGSDEVYKNQIQQKLSAMKSLTIVAE